MSAQNLRGIDPRLANWLLQLVLLAILLGGPFVIRAQDDGGVYSAAELQELSRDVIRPTHLSVGHLPVNAGSVPVVEKETAERWQMETEQWRLTIGKSDWQLVLTNKMTGAEWRIGPWATHPSTWWSGAEQHGVPSPVQTLRRVRALKLTGGHWELEGDVDGSVHLIHITLDVVTSNILRISFSAPGKPAQLHLNLSFRAQPPFFGLGERFGGVRVDGIKTTLRTTDRFGQASDHNWTYVPVPFLWSPHGIGVYFDTTWPSTFDLTQSDDSQFAVELDGGSSDCYFIVDRTPKAMIEDYTSLTGRTPLPPPWTFGVWINVAKGVRDLGAFYHDSALDEARRLRDTRIPVSALWTQDLLDESLNVGWSLWTAGYYPNPAQYADDLHRLGFKALVYTNPWVKTILSPFRTANPLYEEGRRNGDFVLDEAGAISSVPIIEDIATSNIDFTRPEAARWWGSLKARTVRDEHFDGWMEDFGEQIQDSDRFWDGKTGLEIANLYPLLYHKISYESAHRVRADIVEFSRSGYAGSQSYTPVLWGGDQFPTWDMKIGMPSLVSAGITAGLAGFGIWGPDIQSAGRSRELWIRWMEFGALCPVMRDHKWNEPKGAVDLWFDADTTKLFRRYAQLHISLFPYLYTYAKEAADTGVPIIRHLMLEYPDDPAAWRTENEYLLGAHILVAPVIAAGATSRSLYVPPGQWINYWTNAAVKGGGQTEVAAPLDQIPLLIRAGSVLPLIDPDTQTLAADLPQSQYKKLGQELTWRVIPSPGPSQYGFTLYDGTRATVNQERSGIIFAVEGAPLVRKYQVILPVSITPQDVRLSGRLLAPLGSCSSGAAADGWCIDAGTRTLHASFAAGNFMLTIPGR